MYTYDEYRENFQRKLNALLAKRYPVKPSRYTRTKKTFELSGFISDYRSFYKKMGLIFEEGKIREKVKSWRRIENPYVPELPSLCDLCKVLECDISYFFTDTEYNTKEQDIAGNLLHLSPEAIERLSGIKKENTFIQTLDTLLAEDRYCVPFMQIIVGICRYSTYKTNNDYIQYLDSIESNALFNKKNSDMNKLTEEIKKVGFNKLCDKEDEHETDLQMANSELIRIINIISNIDFQKGDFVNLTNTVKKSEANNTANCEEAKAEV